jgi:hypothetical protein
MLTNKMHFLNSCFNSIILDFYMFRTSYVHYQEDCIVHAALYVMFFVLKLNKGPYKKLLIS